MVNKLNKYAATFLVICFISIVLFGLKNMYIYDLQVKNSWLIFFFTAVGFGFIYYGFTIIKKIWF